MKDKTCCLCGSEDTHECGNDYLCDPCCIWHLDKTTDHGDYDRVQKIIDRIHQLKLIIELKNWQNS